MPSARNATFTPAPVKPSDRAVTAPAVVESVPVSGSASGASCGVAAEQVPGGVLTVDAAGPAAAGAPAATAGTAAARRSAAAALPDLIGLSGITAATPGLAVSDATAEPGSRAAIASTSAYRCTSAHLSCAS